MINSKDIQRAYNDLYIELRKYIWGFNIVEEIADLEVASYTAFPDREEIDKCLRKLKSSINNEIREDEDLEQSIKNFEELLKDDSQFYLKLIVPEVE